ncbi:MAG: autotransporter-associated beta strand repeat-containing protein [Chthoniobacter sp.]
MEPRTLGGPSTITVASGAVDTISDIIASGSLTLSSPQPAPPALPIPAGTLILSGANTFSGNVIVSSGILKVTNNQALGDTTGTTSVAADGALVLGNNVTITGEAIGSVAMRSTSPALSRRMPEPWPPGRETVTIDASGARIGAGLGGVLTISGVIQNGAGNSISIASAPGTGTLGTVVISGTANTYTGGTQNHPWCAQDRGGECPADWHHPGRRFQQRGGGFHLRLEWLQPDGRRLNADQQWGRDRRQFHHQHPAPRRRR